MIRYALTCAKSHAFDSWFQSAEAFDRLSGAAQVACPVCGDTKVTKALMAPAVASAEPASLTKPSNPMEEAMAAMRAHVEANSDYVGMNFVAEARKMHQGEVPERSIHGEARLEEARALLEEGVPVAPLPFMPARKTN